MYQAGIGAGVVDPSFWPLTTDNPSDVPVMIPGFTPSTDVVASSGGGIDWTSIIDTVIGTAGQVLTHGQVPTRYPVYTPATTAIGQSMSSLMPLLVLGGAAYLLMKRR